MAELGRRSSGRRRLEDLERRLSEVVDGIGAEREAVEARVADAERRLAEVAADLEVRQERAAERVDLVVDETVRRAEAGDARLVTEIQRLEARVAELEARLAEHGS